MRKINARDFQKSFGKITDGLRAGETVQITKHGKVVGRFTKERKAVKWPDFLAYLEKHSCPPEVGNQLLKEFNDSLS
jgi:hypothetical protein